MTYVLYFSRARYSGSANIYAGELPREAVVVYRSHVGGDCLVEYEGFIKGRANADKLSKRPFGTTLILRDSQVSCRRMFSEVGPVRGAVYSLHLIGPSANDALLKSKLCDKPSSSDDPFYPCLKR